MNFPIAVLQGGNIARIVTASIPFTGPGDVQHPREAWDLWTPADWATMCPGWTILPLIDTPPVVARKRAVPQPMADWTIGADAVTVAYELVDLDTAELADQLAQAKESRKMALAAKRWAVECGGLALPDGSAIATDDRSKTLLNGKYRTAEKFPDRLHRWKGPVGEIVLTSAQIIAFGDAVSDFVQTCFDRELDVSALIDAATTVAEVLAIDIDIGWPG